MTWLEMKREVERQARMDLDSAIDLVNIEFWLNMALDEMDAYHPWWFLEDEYEIALVNDQKNYPFPVLNAAEASSVLSGIDVDSMRTLKQNLSFEWPANIDHQNVNWTDSDETSAAPQVWTTVGKQVALDRPPSSTFVTAHKTLYFRGWKMFPTYGVASDAAEILVPANYHPVVIQIAMKHAWSERGVDQESQLAERGSIRNLELMVGRCLPVRGRTKNVSAPTIWRVPRRRSGRVGVSA